MKCKTIEMFSRHKVIKSFSVHAFPPSLLPLLGEEGNFSDSSCAPDDGFVGILGLTIVKGGYFGKGQPFNGNLWLKNPAIMDLAWSMMPIEEEPSIMV